MSLTADLLQPIARAVAAEAGRVLVDGVDFGHCAEAGTIEGVQQHVYARYYCQDDVQRARWTGPAATGAQREFVNALSRANSGVHGWEHGWTLVGRDPDGRSIVERDGIQIWATPDDFVPDGPTGARGTLRCPKERRRLLTGFYLALGDSPFAVDEPVVRIYWNVSAQGAVVLMERGTQLLNRRGIPFRLKVVGDPASYARIDSAVLYAPDDVVPRLAEVLPALTASLQGLVRPRVPRFTRRLAPGVGAAEDPGSGASFGQARCRLAAEGIMSGARDGATRAEEFCAEMLGSFRIAGIDLERPWLRPLSASDPFDALMVEVDA